MIIDLKDGKNDTCPRRAKNFLFFAFVFLILFVLIAVTLFFVNDIDENQTKLNFSKVFSIIPGGLIKEVDRDNPLTAPVTTYSKLAWRSFGDNFSSPAYLDMSKTDMVLDKYTTSLVFPPLYSFNKNRDCENDKCNLGDSNLIFFNSKPACFSGSCLTISNNKILLNNKNINYPADLKGKKIVRVDAGSLSSTWVISFIFSVDGQEQAYVYFFDGKTFKPIINNKTKEKILTSYGRGQGSIIVGGVDSDFIILYAGYEDFAYRFKDDKLSDISRFFSLRISTAGFKPVIIRQGEGKQTVWYLPGYSKYGLKLIKLWQNNTDNILGSYVFDKIFPDKNSIMAVRTNSQRLQLDLIFKDEVGNFSLWNFQDKGFDNTANRKVTSINIMKDEELVEGAIIRDIGLVIDGQNDAIYETSFNTDMVKLALANFDDNFIEVKPQTRLDFSAFYPNLRWQAEFKKGDNNEYSPWFDYLNYLDYFVVAE